jgi:5'-nucleotidase
MQVRRVILALSAAALVAACSSSGSSSSNSTSPGSPTTTAPANGAPTTTETGASTPTGKTTTPGGSTTSTPAGDTTTTLDTSTKLTVLVTNDDGITAPGLDAVVTALKAMPNVSVVVVAPSTNQSGTSDKTTSGGAKGHTATTKSGVEGTAVDGYPADSVNYAIDTMKLQPDVVVSGANSGVNFGPLVAVSGTVGAARTAARRGIPAIAVSAGVDDSISAAAGAKFVVDEIATHRSSFGFDKNTAHTVDSINVPTCAAGTSVRGIVEAPTSTSVTLADVGKFLKYDCTSKATNPADDITALNIGFASRSVVPADL